MWIISILLLGASFSSFGKSAKDSATQVVTNLSVLYKKGTLKEKAYLDSVNSTLRLILSEDIDYTNKELLQLLSFYRNVVWSGKQNEKYKQEYYTILSNQAKMASRFGEMLYYGEKLRAAEEKSGSGPSITSLMFMADYYNIKNAYAHSLSLYKQNRQFVRNIPIQLRHEPTDIREVVRAINLTGYLGDAAFNELDTFSGNEIRGVITEIQNILETKYKDNHDAPARLKYIQLLNLYKKGTALHLPDLVRASIEGLDQLRADHNTPDYLKNHIEFGVTDNKIGYFLDHGPNDSARRYLKIIEQLYSNMRDPYNAYMIKKYDARLLYNEGRYKESIDTLRRAIEFMDVAMTATVAESGDMMYTMAKVEEQQILMAEAAAQQKKTDQQLLLLIAGFLLLLFGGMFIFHNIRKKQKAKFLEFKLNLARNLHDEANPALLYAKALAKTNRLEETSATVKSELEEHIEHTMELIRSLAQDLKSEKQFSIADLITAVKQPLQKIASVSGFQFIITEEVNVKRFLSHYQFSQLKAILQECILNTIKHASFDHINIRFSNHKDILSIRYSDNGRGWITTEAGIGIGMENITQRMHKLNADLDINNHYPDGYHIDFQMKLH
ncbi:hypothetical protein DBR32_15560 [Taibaiella sp. KBW10]|uniref:sensor histidine kinase n=1 Tax=Taibaiella sp. KBW10 TaxID=2153357 RepID=UPI000F5A2747|nr:hypothetical protein [Taibaiella sp. KBW10]RQO29674.1 hypothetical protein DBR32_15560 [Taibaiella sp. KBW10]